MRIIVPEKIAAFFSGEKKQEKPNSATAPRRASNPAVIWQKLERLERMVDANASKLASLQRRADVNEKRIESIRAQAEAKLEAAGLRQLPRLSRFTTN